ncbi:MAG: hypothetical protein Kow0042_02280 [Calditrichia bacterium]
MKKFQTAIGFMFVLVFLLYLPGFAQGGMHGGGHGFDPDSLTQVTVSGTAIVDTNFMYPKYFLDEDGDGLADYFLNFGPPWYQPDSSNATRPNDGDFITIMGGLVPMDTTGGFLPIIIVYEINGLFWRDPFEPFWSHLGHHGGHHGGPGGHHSFGWMHDTLEIVNLYGIALVDTTFHFNHYYLDEDFDGYPDYFLNFGPPWYVPPSGATRPADGDTVSIVGGKLDRDSLDMVIVFEINGLVWRDSTTIGPHFGGGWIHKNMNQARYMYTPWDTLSGMHVNPGWHQGGGGGGHQGMQDSLFCQMLQLFPHNLPGVGNMNAFAGFEMGIFAPNGKNLLMGGGMMGGHLQFNNQVQVRLHYNDIQIQGMNINENTIKVSKWDYTTNSWSEITTAVVNTNENLVVFQTNDLTSFYVLTGQSDLLSIDDPVARLANGFTLEQNYPNPFNPTTTIPFELNKTAKVQLTIYNVLGQAVAVLLNKEMNAGPHQIQFDASSLTSGIYFYELKVDGNSQIRKMNLLK